MNEDGMIKTIASLRVDITNAKTPLGILSQEFETLDQKIKKVQTSLSAMNQAMGRQGSAISGATRQTAIQTAATQAQTAATTAATMATKTQTTAVNQMSNAIEKNSVLASQWERKISWFTNIVEFALFQYSELLAVA